MDGQGGRPHKAERDALTVEVGYALVSAAFLAGVVFAAVAGPAFLFDLPGLLSALLPKVGLALAPIVFVVRVVSVLVDFRRAAQPSQPGRTSPDS
ncbi:MULTISPECIES: DUF6332 family protein [Streptomyces]|uniref:DUF6332 family protein n=1 Tax=Streptomyces gilvifuscus TaxID=1550617 RepID=A0ABT5FRH2_9ACTN|nr:MULTISPECIES: DUF6332 family protein [Streptomyces]MBK3642077.1 hypothetical protein [Streptomyces sp. MBT33]MDC2955085.1 DUF6332 family protein [Streptomyces gilvifuscus]